MGTRTAEREWTARINGTDIRIGEIGRGAETVVFSPALFTNREMFDPLVEELMPDHRCIRYDHRGQGESGFGAHHPNRHLLGAEGLYDDAVALLDQLEVERCHWVGASIGGYVGVRLAARHPGRIRSLVLIGLSTRLPTRAELLLTDALFGVGLRVGALPAPVGSQVRRRLSEMAVRNMFGRTFATDPARTEDQEVWRRRFEAQLVPAALPMLRGLLDLPGNPPALLARVTAPTLIISGEDDESVDDAQGASEVIPDARLVIVPGAGHMVLVEEPEAATAAITEFIRRAPATA